MVETDFIPEDALQSIARQIGFEITSLAEPEFLSSIEIELAETLQFWVLSAEPGEQGIGNSLAHLLQPTGRWHHQIKFNGAAAAFARSSEPDEDSDQWVLCELFISPFAERIARGIDQIEHLESNNSIVRLFIAPAYKIHALWLVNQDETSQVLVIDRPEEFIELPTNRLVDSRNFLAAVSSLHDIVGISYAR